MHEVVEPRYHNLGRVFVNTPATSSTYRDVLVTIVSRPDLGRITIYTHSHIWVYCVRGVGGRYRPLSVDQVENGQF